MKKTLALILAIVMVIGLAACGGSSSESSAPAEAAPAADAAPAGTEAAAPAPAAAEPADFSGTTLVFSSDAVGSASYNYIVELAKHLEQDGGFGLIDVQPTNPGGMGAPYLFAGSGVDLAFINGAPAKWAME
ncbi:MAG: hypothetical protein IIU41_01865, partial [Oscillospiraceae bacterium]|nr:hypothetical protein [Oscillospiraceae bacterium]